jgi:hypothetical protein
VFSWVTIPYIRRQLGDGDYRLAGDAYIHGFMNSEGDRRARPGDVKEFWIKQEATGLNL